MEEPSLADPFLTTGATALLCACARVLSVTSRIAGLIYRPFAYRECDLAQDGRGSRLSDGS